LPRTDTAIDNWSAPKHCDEGSHVCFRWGILGDVLKKKKLVGSPPLCYKGVLYTLNKGSSRKNS